jgi:hypothetical protein
MNTLSVKRTCCSRNKKAVLRIRIRDPGLDAFLTPGSGIRDGRKSASGSGIRDEQPGSYFLELRNHKFFDEDPGDPGWRQFGSGIRDEKKSDPGSGINIPDPPHCKKVWHNITRLFDSEPVNM